MNKSLKKKVKYFSNFEVWPWLDLLLKAAKTIINGDLFAIAYMWSWPNFSQRPVIGKTIVAFEITIVNFTRTASRPIMEYEEEVGIFWRGPQVFGHLNEIFLQSFTEVMCNLPLIRNSWTYSTCVIFLECDFFKRTCKNIHFELTIFAKILPIQCHSCSCSLIVVFVLNKGFPLYSSFKN
jgi:hypothetical protein